MTACANMKPLSTINTYVTNYAEMTQWCYINWRT